jgi:predicted HD phosphohydrolase
VSASASETTGRPDKFIAGMHDVGDLLGRTATAIKQNDETDGKKLVEQLQAKTAVAVTEPHVCCARAAGQPSCHVKATAATARS